MPEHLLSQNRRNVLLAIGTILVAIGAVVYSQFNAPRFSDALAEYTPTEPFEVVDLLGRGKGLIATRDIHVCVHAGVSLQVLTNHSSKGSS